LTRPDVRVGFPRQMRQARIAALDPRELRIAGVAMLGAGLLLPVVPGHPSLVCPLRATTGVPCPLCGLSTSVEETVRLHLADAFRANPFGLLLVAGAAVLLLLRPRRLRLPLPVLYAALAASWLFELHRFSIL
jgi:uncharacterized protein DUF2752